MSKWVDDALFVFVVVLCFVCVATLVASCQMGGLMYG